MSDRGYVALSPDRVSTAAEHLRDRVRETEILDLSIRGASLDAQVEPHAAIAACREINEELSILATLLTVRAGEARGFTMPGSDWDFESDLLASLIDDTGHRATITGPLAIALLLEHRVGVVGEGPDAALSIEQLRVIALDPNTEPELAAAAGFLAANPFVIAEATPLGIGGEFGYASSRPGEIPLADVAFFLERNELLTTLLATANGEQAQPSGWVDLTDADLWASGVDPAGFDTSGLPRNTHDLTVEAVHHGTFTHSPDTARSFVATLPVHLEDGISIAFGTVGTEAVNRLFDAATADLHSPSDPRATDENNITRWEVIAHLPETRDGVRNQLITQSYADITIQLGFPINGDLDPTAPDFKGHNWFHLGVVASDSVAAVITGDQTVYGFPISLAVREEIANGNQAIFAHFTTELTRRLRGGGSHDSTIEQAFDLIDEAESLDDIAGAQLLMAESSVLLALVEQRVVDPYLQLAALEGHERLGTRTLSTLGGDHRTAEEVMTDMGVLRFEVDGESVRAPIGIGDEVAPSEQANNAVEPEALFENLPTTINWDLEAAHDWSEYGERMPIIGQVPVTTLTDPALTSVADSRRSR